MTESMTQRDTDTALLTELQERMLRIRAFEQTVHQIAMENEIPGAIHLYEGQEAIAVGVCDALGPDDSVSATYRGHGAALALGTEPERLFAEMLGRVTGTNGGRGGSMNVVNLERNLIGCFGIVGASIAAATGSALASWAAQEDSCAVAFFGDGAANQAYFHECLNFASVRSLPAVYVCENNQYSEFSSVHAVTAGAGIASRASAYGMPGIEVDGNDVLAVRAVAETALARARAGDGPTLIEAVTYRHRGHGRPDTVTYRSKEEMQEWLARDPLLRYVDQLDDAVLAEIGQRIDGEIAAALEAARAAPYPTVTTASAYKEAVQ